MATASSMTSVTTSPAGKMSDLEALRLRDFILQGLLEGLGAAKAGGEEGLIQRESKASVPKASHIQATTSISRGPASFRVGNKLHL